MPLFFTTEPCVGNYMHNIFAYDVHTLFLRSRSIPFMTKTLSRPTFRFFEVLNLLIESEFVVSSCLNF
jgi:hypothetical protein